MYDFSINKFIRKELILRSFDLTDIVSIWSNLFVYNL